MAEAKKSTKKIIDVQHPGKTAPSGTSKSVIVTNRPIMKDPMVVDEDGKPEESAPAATTYKSGGEAVIKPLSEQDSKESSKADEPEQTDSSETDSSKTVSQLAEEASNKDSKKTDETPPPESKEEAKEPEIKLPIAEDDKKDEDEDDKKSPIAEEKVGEKKDEKAADENADSNPEEDKTDPAKSDKDGDPKEIEEAEEDKELKKRRAEVNKLVESKKYSLPIKTVENRHNRRAVIIGVVVSILLILAWVNIALDAGLISLGGVKAYTNFF